MRLRTIATIVALPLLLGPISAAQADIVSFGEGGASDGLTATYNLGIAVGSAGDVYSLDPDPYNRVLRFGSGLAFTTSWGGQGTGPGMFQLPRGVALDSAGNVRVGEANGSRVQKFSPAGDLLGSQSLGQSTGDLAIDDDDALYLVGGGGIQKFDAAGASLASWTGASYLTGAAFDAVDGRLYTADQTGNRIRVFDKDLTLVDSWGTLGGQEGQLNQPSDIAVAGEDVYVTEAGTVGNTTRIQRFSKTGAFRGALSEIGQPTSIATDAAGRLYVQRFNSMLRIDPLEPIAAFGTYLPPQLGQPATFSARESRAPFTTIDRYEWDLDGDGSFETDTGTTPEATTVFTTTGAHTASVRVSVGAKSDTASVGFTVSGPPESMPSPAPAPGPAAGPAPPTPPAGPVGVSVNGGALFTNTPNVSLSIVWPLGARTMAFANDGGFTGSTFSAVAAQRPWRLATTGPERLPKTIYARFDSTGSQTLTDDIVLDETAPVLEQATLSSGAAGPARAAAAKTRRFTVRLRGRDKTSGVGRAQLTINKRKPGKALAYKAKLTVRLSAPPRFARVQDRAGNWSKWRAIRAR